MKINNTFLAADSKCYLLCLLAGAILPLGLAPLNIWPAIILSLSLLILLLKGQNGKSSFWRALFFGLGLNGVGVSWVFVSIHFYGGTPAWLALIGTAGFVIILSLAFLAFPFWLYGKLKLSRYPLITFPALWVLAEWSKSWFLSGFPWIWAGYGFIDTPIEPLATIAGVLGLSYVAALSATLVYTFFQSDQTHRLYSGIGLAVLWLACWILHQWQWTQPILSKAQNVAVIQANIPQDQKWDPAFREQILETYDKLTGRAWDSEFILWPEAAYPVYYHQALSTITNLDMRATEKSVAIVSGVARWEPQESGDDRFYNSVFVIGDGEGIYNKQRLVPFGEFVPLQSLLRGLIPFLNLPMSSFNEGSSDQPALIANGLRFSAYICYEIVYPEIVRQQAKDRDFLVTISNDAWFGHSWGPLQHFQMARMRALETGKYLIRGTNTGITAIIDHNGKVLSSLPQFEQDILKGTIYGTKGTTPFVEWGHWPVLTLAFSCFLLGAFLSLKSTATSPVRPLYHSQ